MTFPKSRLESQQVYYQNENKYFFPDSLLREQQNVVTCIDCGNSIPKCDQDETGRCVNCDINHLIIPTLRFGRLSDDKTSDQGGGL
jgi:hypothetical protein